MLGRAITFALVGLEPRRVEVEAHLRTGQQPSFQIVGLADRACQEAKHRVRSGVHSSRLLWPGEVITVNLAPAALRKEGTGFDVAIALTVLAASGQVPADRLAEHACIGELGLDGRVRPVAGTIAAAEGAARAGFARLLCSADSSHEAALAGIEAVGVRHIGEAVGYLRGEDELVPASQVTDPRAPPDLPDLADVRGQERGRRALELAATGQHNLLLAGPPGTGKTMLGRRLPSILPPLTREEALEVTRIHSVAGTLPPGAGLISAPPFRAPHHGASAAAIIGGGAVPRPGEVSLAHRGVLLLDELPEYTRAVLEALRQPLEDGVVVGRARRWAGAVPGAVPARGHDEPLPVRRARRPAAAMRVHPGPDHRVPREGLARAARPLRPRGHDAAAAGGGARGWPGRVVGRGAGACGRRCVPAPLRAPSSHDGRVRASRQRRRPASPHGSRPRPRRACRANGGGAGRVGGRTAGARRRGALVPVPDGPHEPVTIRVVRRRDDGYPALLAQIPDPPSRLWVRGDAPFELLDRPSVAIVGARACSGYGRSVARLLANEAAAAGAVVVSGMARGVDGEAHRGALAAGAATVAVLGCGVDRDYPAAHAELARSIVETGGLVVSEYEPGVEPAPWRFPARNRVIAGLARATVVVEARERSGALITADFALEDGREVLAVPGEITSRLSAGTNALLRIGATPATSAADVLEALGLDAQPSARSMPDDPVAAAVLAAVEAGAGTPDELSRTTGLDAGELAAALALLELAGAVAVEEGVVRSTIAR